MEPGQAKDILDKLLYELYEVPLLVVYNNIAKIVKQNVELELNITNDSAIRYIRFNGSIFFTANLPEYRDRQSVIYNKDTPNRSMIMHNDTKNALLPEIAERTLLETEQKECASYLRLLFNQCKTLYDIKAVLPDSVWNILQIKIPTEEELTLPESEIYAVQDIYREESETLKERVFLNLLLKKA